MVINISQIGKIMTYKKLKKILQKMQSRGCSIENLTIFQVIKFYKEEGCCLA